MRNLPKEKFIYTEGLIKRLEAKIASLEQRVTNLQEETTRKNEATAPGRTSYGAISQASSGRNGIARYIDVRKTYLVLDDGIGGIGYKSFLQSLTPSKNNVVWDATAGCFKFYGVYKE